MKVTVQYNPFITMPPSLSNLRSFIGLKETESPHQLRSEVGEVHTECDEYTFVPRNITDIDAWYKQNLPEVTDRLITPTEDQVFVCCPHDEDARYSYPILNAAINKNPSAETKASSSIVRQDNEEQRLRGLCQIMRLEGSLSRVCSKKYSFEDHYLHQTYDLEYQGSFRSRPSGKTRKSLTAAYRLTDKGTVAYDIPGTLAAWTEGGRLHWVPKKPVRVSTIRTHSLLRMRQGI